MARSSNETTYFTTKALSNVRITVCVENALQLHIFIMRSYIQWQKRQSFNTFCGGRRKGKKQPFLKFERSLHSRSSLCEVLYTKYLHRRQKSALIDLRHDGTLCCRNKYREKTCWPKTRRELTPLAQTRRKPFYTLDGRPGGDRDSPPHLSWLNSQVGHSDKPFVGANYLHELMKPE